MANIQAFVSLYGYSPDVDQLRLIVGKLYELSDRNTRDLIEFGLIASAGVLSSLHVPMPSVGALSDLE